MNAPVIAKCECPNCGINIEFEADRAGERAPCPQCDQLILLRIQPPAAPAVVATAPKKLTAPCPACAAMVSPKAVACPHCGEPFESPKSLFETVFKIVFYAFVALFLIGACVGTLAALFVGVTGRR